MAILVPTWSSLDTYTTALTAEGIPHFALLREEFYNRREVVDMLLALEVIRDPTDNRALIGFLRSPFIGVRDETLLAVALADGWTHYERLKHVECAEGDLLRTTRALIERYSSLRDRIPPDALLRSLVQETGYLAHLALLGDDGKQGIANVRKLLSILEQHRDLGVGDLVRLLHDSRDLQEEEGDAILFGEREDVVTITSIHMAKGLEWPVVFWCDANGEPRGNHEKLVLGRDRFRLGAFDLKPAEQDEDWQALKNADNEEQDAERKRLWYVASTRARDLLVVSAIPRGRPRSTKTLASRLCGLLPSLTSAPNDVEFECGTGRFTAAVRQTDEPIEPGDPWNSEELPIGAQDVVSLPLSPLAIPAGIARRSATEFLAFEKCALRHWFKYTLGLREPVVGSDAPEWGGATARGSIVHEMLELAAENEDAEQTLEMSIGRWDPDAPPPETDAGATYRTELREEVDRVLGDARYSDMANAPGARRELRFMHVVDESLVLHGSIDLAAPVNGTLRLLDVKTGDTDAAGARKRAEGYRVQREVYVTAAQALSGMEVDSFAFHFSGPGEHISLPVTAEARADAAARIGDVAVRMLVTDPALTELPHLCYRCGYRKVGWCKGVTGS
jgi:ATP-dependent helicase/nuclease subunit A